MSRGKRRRKPKGSFINPGKMERGLGRKEGSCQCAAGGEGLGAAGEAQAPPGKCKGPSGRVNL